MLKVQRSRSTRNAHFALAPRRANESNSAWIARHAAADTVHALLVGGTSTWDLRLRTAQSHMRDDLSQSHWSHVALLGPVAQRPERTRVYEIPLLPKRGLATFPNTNGVLDSFLGDYDDASTYPNLGLIVLPLPWPKVQNKVQEFKRQRTAIDALELHIAWLTFAWGVGRLNNPLYDQVGFASAALLEYVASALGYDLTPAFPSSSSCPEAIWQAASYWHETPRTGPGDAPAHIGGAYVLGGAAAPVQTRGRTARRRATRSASRP
ncbi:MAG TPA: hypothetical protein VFZ61_07470 [Polyangiales bacterium]